MLRPFSKLVSILSALLLSTACSSQTRTKQPSITSGEGDDAGSSASDAAISGDDDDGGEHHVGSGATELCSYGDADLFTLGADAAPGVLSSAASADGFGVVFQRIDGALFIAAIPATGPAVAAMAVTSADEHANAPQLIASDARFLLAYRVDVAGKQSLRVRGLMDAFAPATVLSDNLAYDDAHGAREAWAVASTPDGAVAAWIESGKSGTQLRALKDTAAVAGSAMTLALPSGHAPERLGLGRLETGALLLAFRETTKSGEGAVFGQALTSTLGASGVLSELSKNAVADGPIGLAARADSSGLLYPALDGDVRQALKLRRIDASGAPEGPALNLANAPRVVNTGSITAFGRGYAVVYRELPSLGRDHTAIRIAFVNPFGSVVYDAELARLPANAPPDAATTVTSAGRSGVVVSWTEPDGDAARVRSLRMTCPGALVLCGGKVD